MRERGGHVYVHFIRDGIYYKYGPLSKSYILLLQLKLSEREFYEWLQTNGFRSGSLVACFCILD